MRSRFTQVVVAPFQPSGQRADAGWSWYLPTPVVGNGASALERRPGSVARLADLGSEAGAAPSVALRLVFRRTPEPGVTDFS